MDLVGKVALVTGGARGLGRGFTEALLDRGANVVISDVQVSLGLDVAQELDIRYGQGRVMFIACDVTKQTEMEGLFRQIKSIFGEINVVVNNAGINGEDIWEKVIQVNLLGVMRGTYLAAEHMSKTNGGKGGVIVNISSTSGLTGVPYIPAYSASKHGVVGLTRSMAVSVGEDEGVRVVALCPSFTDTNMVRIGKEFMQTEPESQSKHDISNVGMMQISNVVEGFMRLIDDTHNNGGIMAVTPKGMEYRYPRSIKGKL